MLIIEIKDQALTLLSVHYKRSKFVLDKAKTIEMQDSFKNFLLVPKSRNNLMALLKDFSPGNTKTAICVSLSSLIYRDIEVPKADEKTTMQLVKNELINALNLSQDYLIDYTILGENIRNGNSTNKVLVSALQANLLNEYIEIFKEAGLRIQSIDVGLNALYKYLNITGQITKNNTVMIVDVTLNNLRQFLFEKGTYSFYRNTKINRDMEGGVPALILEYADHIEKMLKFIHTQGQKDPVDTMLLIGKYSITNKLRNHLNSKLDVQSVLMAQPKILDCTHRSFESTFVMGLGTFFSMRYKPKKDINLLLSYNAYFKIKPFMVNLDKHYKKIVFALVLTLLAWSGFLGYRYFTLQEQISTLTTYLNQSSVVKALTRVETMRNHIAKIEEMKLEFESVETVLASIPRYNQSVILKLYASKPENLDITELRFTESSVEFSLVTADSNLIHQYVSDLNQASGFEQANYTTYVENDGIYQCTVTFDLKGDQ